MKNPLGKRGTWIAFMGGVLVFSTITFQVFLKPLLKRSEVLDRLLPEKAKRLSEMKELAAQYKSLKENQERVARSINKAAKKSLLSELEGFAIKANVKEKISSMKPSTSTVSEKYKEDAIEVEFKEVNLDQVIKVLHQIEYSGDVLGVEWIRIKSLSPVEGLLNIKLKVFTLTER
jgi:type II secretory pathway component PulM